MTLKDKLWEEVSTCMDPDNYDGTIEFAVRHGEIAVAVYLWCSTGASKYDYKKCPISSKEFQVRAELLLKKADSFECKECNHIGVYDKGDFETINWCYNCGSKTTKEKI